MELEKEFDTAEVMVRFKCDVHPWMLAYGAVMTHPFFDITGPDGKFSIKDLDPGEYEIEAWHEKLGTKVGKVTVAAGSPATFDFTFTRPSKK